MDESQDGDAKKAHHFRPTSIATGLPWHVARRKRDRQLIAAAKKGLAFKGGAQRGDHSMIGRSSSSNSGEGGAEEEEGEDQAGEMDISIDEALQRGADVNAADYNGNTALHYACEEGYADVVEYLLQKKDISVDATATMDWTPLHSAAYKGRTEIIRMVPPPPTRCFLSSSRNLNPVDLLLEEVQSVGCSTLGLQWGAEVKRCDSAVAISQL